MTISITALRALLAAGTPRRCSCSHEAGDSDCAEHPTCSDCGNPFVGSVLQDRVALLEKFSAALPELLDEVERLRREVNECDTFHGAVTAQIAHYRRQATSADNDRDTAIAERDRLRALVEEARERGSRLAEHVSDQWLIADAGDADRIDAIRDEAKGAK